MNLVLHAALPPSSQRCHTHVIRHFDREAAILHDFVAVNVVSVFQAVAEESHWTLCSCAAYLAPVFGGWAA